jgi:hypothetical protein
MGSTLPCSGEPVRSDATCRRCRQSWTVHVGAYDQPTDDLVEADFGPDGWKNLYCPEVPREPVQ